MSANQMNVQITTENLFDVFRAGTAINKTIYIAGPPGVGKSDIVRAYADELLDQAILKNPSEEEYYESIRGDNCVDIRLSLETPDTLKGIVIPQEVDPGKYQTIYAYNERYPVDSRWVGVIFFDELSSAPPSLQTIAYQALLDRRIGGLVYPDGATVIAAGNRVGDGGVAYELPDPVQNRIVQVELRPDFEAWTNGFAIKKGVEGSILSFLKSSPQFLSNGDQDSDCPSFASPRSWTVADALLKQVLTGTISERLAFIMLEGTIGAEATAAFKLHYEFGGKLPSSKDILDGVAGPIEIDDKSAFYYVSYSCMSLWGSRFMNNDISDKELLKMADNLLDYMLKEMKDEVELQGSFAVQLHKFAVSNGIKQKRKLALMLPKCQAFKDMVRDVNKLQQRVAEADAASA